MLQERLYFFQFPDPLPEFKTNAPSDDKGKGVDRSGSTQNSPKTVKFADGTKPAAPAAEGDKATTEKLDGVIGQLEVYQSGAVKMRLSNGILLDVSGYLLRTRYAGLSILRRSTLPHNRPSYSTRYTSAQKRKNSACWVRSIDGSLCRPISTCSLQQWTSPSQRTMRWRGSLAWTLSK